MCVCVCVRIRIYIYIYMLAPPQDLRLRIRGSWGMGCTKHCNAQKIPKFLIPNLTKPCNAQKIPKNPEFWHLCPGQDHVPENFGIFRALQCFVKLRPRNTAMLKKFQNFQPQNSRNTVMLKKFQKFQNSGIYVQAKTRFPKKFGIFKIF